MEEEMEIFRAWLRKHVKEDREITGLELAKLIGLKNSVTISHYHSGRLDDGVRTLVNIPLEKRTEILRVTKTPRSKMIEIGEKVFDPYQFKEIHQDQIKKLEEIAKKINIRQKKNNKNIAGDECTTCPANKDNVFKINNSLEGKHLSIIRKFKNKSMACSLNEALVELEALDDRELARVVSDVLDRIERLKAAKKRTSNGQD